MKREVFKIKPKDGLQLRFAGIKRYLKPEGELVEWSSYWHRRLLDGDITIIKDEEKKPSKKKEFESDNLI